MANLRSGYLTVVVISFKGRRVRTRGLHGLLDRYIIFSGNFIRFSYFQNSMMHCMCSLLYLERPLGHPNLPLYIYQ
jgi:hypothetical protein